MTNNQVKMMKW